MNDAPRELDRREVLQWMGLAAASIAWLDCTTFPGARPRASRIGTDPDLLHPVVPWPRTLTPAQRETVRALCDLIVPADDRSPAASEVGVVDFVDEWVSAPYGGHQQDRGIIVAGLAWIDAEAGDRFGRRFHALELEEQRSICDEIAMFLSVPPERREDALFFLTLRNLTTGAFYTTRAGMRDLGYEGNVPLDAFEGPSPALRAHLGLD